MALLNKYGMDGVKGHKLAPYELAVQNRKIKSVYQRMDSMAHINTQGASMDLFMPEWAGGKVKPLTLYKRMAYAATVNTWNNTRIAWKNQEMMRFLVYGAGSYLTGESLLWIGKELLGHAPPEENSPWWTKIQVALWRGEVGGFLSGMLHPGDWTESFGDMFVPVLYETGETIVQELIAAKGGFQTPYESIDKILSRSVSAYNQSINAWEKQTNPYKSESSRWKSLQKDFEKEFKVQEEADYARSLRSPYFKALRLAFESGNDKDFAEQYMITVLAVANDILNDHYIVNVTSIEQAIVEAEERVERNIKNYNPNPASFYKDSNVAQLNSLDFALWVKDGMGIETLRQMQKTENEYFALLEEYKARFPYHARRLNVQEMFKKYVKPEKKKRIKR